MKKKSILQLSLVFATFLAAPRASGDEGRIPIYQPTTITAPGSYVLTRNIAGTSPAVITIQASQVTLDLGGWQIESDDPQTDLVLIGEGYEKIRIRNGGLRGGANGIRNAGNAQTLNTSVWLEGLEISDTLYDAISLYNSNYFEITSCRIHNTGSAGMSISGTTGTIVGNLFTDIGGRAISGSGDGLIIRDNVMRHVGNGGIGVDYGVGAIIENNAVFGDPTLPYPTIGIQVTALGSRILRNVVYGFARGLLVANSGHRVAENVISGNVDVGFQPGDGIFLLTTQSVIEGNQIEGNEACGINFFTGSAGNAYRNNMIRGNAGGAVCDVGTGNTNAGGNIL